MASWLPWRHISLSSALPADEVRRRLSASTADWGTRGWGAGVAPPPWKGDAFAAELAPFPGPPVVVLSGTVRTQGGRTRVDAVVRPSGAVLGAFTVFVLVVAANVPSTGGLVRIVFALQTFVAYLVLLAFSASKSRRVQAIVETACTAIPGTG